MMAVAVFPYCCRGNKRCHDNNTVLQPFSWTTWVRSYQKKTPFMDCIMAPGWLIELSHFPLTV